MLGRTSGGEEEEKTLLFRISGERLGGIAAGRIGCGPRGV